MAIIGLFRCDLCQTEHRPDEYWWNNANGGTFTVCRDGINGVCKWDHLCPACRSELCEAVGKVIDSRKPKK